jgi:porphobilinogen synthase
MTYEHPSFPQYRPRRLRRGPLWREATRDVHLTPADLVLPLFIVPGKQVRKPVGSMPDVEQMSADVAVEAMRDLRRRGLFQFILFGVIPASQKDAQGSAAFSPENPVCVAIQAARDAGLDAVLQADLCFCEYTDHGHCGPLHADPHVTVDNDATLAGLGRQAALLAKCGADVIAPSGMMDGMVRAIRGALDREGHEQVAIMSYSIKYASAMYGPFREAAEGGMKFGDRKGYQMDYRRAREWRTELALDVAEGADIVMIKPAAAYLDIIRQVRDATDLPVAAYHVSGEYSMIHAAAQRGWIDLKQAAVETTYAIKRAGADLILTYFAPKLLEWL